MLIKSFPSNYVHKFETTSQQPTVNNVVKYING